jgi:hypothetical protein
VTDEEKCEMLEDGLSEERRENFRAAARAVEEWEKQYPRGLEEALRWSEQIRELFGDPPVDLRPWVGNDFRL